MSVGSCGCGFGGNLPSHISPHFHAPGVWGWWKDRNAWQAKECLPNEIISAWKNDRLPLFAYEIAFVFLCKWVSLQFTSLVACQLLSNKVKFHSVCLFPLSETLGTVGTLRKFGYRCAAISPSNLAPVKRLKTLKTIPFSSVPLPYPGVIAYVPETRSQKNGLTKLTFVDNRG